MTNIYKPQKAKIAKVETMSGDVKLFRLVPEKPLLLNSQRLAFIPAQFFLIGLWGYGEAPFGAASSPLEQRFIDFGIRKMGTVTSAFHRLKKGDEVTLRGPYGNGFPLDFFEGNDIVMVTGGCGIPPIATLIEYVIAKRKRFGNVSLLYGAATPDDLLFEDHYSRWEEKKIKVLLTVDHPTPGWKGKVGLVSELMKEIEINPTNTIAVMCGPGPMVRALEKILRPLGITDRRIFLSEERKMSCGIGKCQHCTTGDKYVCLDGPVFNYDEVQGNWD